MEGADGWRLSIPPLEKGDQGGFDWRVGRFPLGHRGSLLRRQERRGRNKSPLAPLFQRGVTEELPGFVWSTRNCCASHTRRVQTELMGRDQFSKGDFSPWDSNPSLEKHAVSLVEGRGRGDFWAE